MPRNIQYNASSVEKSEIDLAMSYYRTNNTCAN